MFQKLSRANNSKEGKRIILLKTQKQPHQLKQKNEIITNKRIINFFRQKKY